MQLKTMRKLRAVQSLDVKDPFISRGLNVVELNQVINVMFEIFIKKDKYKFFKYLAKNIRHAHTHELVKRAKRYSKRFM